MIHVYNSLFRLSISAVLIEYLNDDYSKEFRSNIRDVFPDILI